MFNFFRKKEKNIIQVAKKELSENKEALISLKKYDEGEKEISTDRIKRHLPNIRTAS